MVSNLWHIYNINISYHSMWPVLCYQFLFTPYNKLLHIYENSWKRTKGFKSRPDISFDDVASAML